MSDSIGPAAFPAERSLFLGAETLATQPYSDETAKKIDAEIHRILEEAHQRVRTILTERRDAMLKVAERLQEKEAIDGEEFREIVGQRPGEAEKPRRRRARTSP